MVLAGVLLASGMTLGCVASPKPELPGLPNEYGHDTEGRNNNNTGIEGTGTPSPKDAGASFLDGGVSFERNDGAVVKLPNGIQNFSPSVDAGAPKGSVLEYDRDGGDGL